MPLPAENTPWPPLPLRPALDQWRVWGAWWAGRPEQIAEVYGGSYGTGRGVGAVNRPSQYRGGVVGAMARMWWGRPQPANEPETRLHVPLAGDLCRTAADMLFSEPLKATTENADTSARLETLLDDVGQSKLTEAAELVAALGGGYLRPVYDRTVSDRAWLDAVAADQALPEWRWGRLSAVTFWRVVARDADHDLVWRHLERHEPGWILHGLYCGTGDELGRPVPLQDSEATAGYAPLVNADGAIPSGYPLLDVTYIPHMLPHPAWRDEPLLAPMGRSVLDGCEGMLGALDMTHSSWMSDVDLARGRVIVPDSWLDDHGPGLGAGFNPDRRYFTPVSSLKMERPEIVQFDIRVDGHRDTARELVASILRHAGYADGSVGVIEEGGGLKTATEVTSDERRSFVTRGRQIGYWRPALAMSALPALLAVDAFAFGRTLDLSQPVNVEFADSVQEDLLTIANTVEVLHRAEAVSIATRVRMVHPEWSEPQVQAEVQRIRDDKSAAAPAIAAPFDYGPGVAETDDQRAALDDDQDDEGEPEDDDGEAE